MAQTRPDLTEPALRRWAQDLAIREARLAAEQARFERYVARFQARADEIVEQKTDALREAFQTIRQYAFPDGLNLRIEPCASSLGNLGDLANVTPAGRA